ncbi:MAG: TIM barrel protein [archaeon]
MVENYEFFYDGTPSSLEPTYGEIFTGYRVPAGQIGGTTSVQTANQVKEVSNLLSTGMKAVEVSMIQPEVFESIPKEHFREIHRLQKLTGSEVSVHAPIIEPSGFTQQGWSEQNREQAVIQMTDTVLRAHAMNPDGEMPVTFHASAIPGSETMPANMIKDLTEEEKAKYGKDGKVPTTMMAVDQESGQIIPLRRETRFYPDRITKTGEGKVYSPEKELEIANASYWDNKLSNLVFYKDRGDELMRNYYPLIAGRDPRTFNDQQNAALKNVRNAQIYYRNSHTVLNSLFNEAYKTADQKGRELLQKAAKQYETEFNESTKVAQQMQKALGEEDPSLFQGALQGLIDNMMIITNSQEHCPKKYVPIEDFATKKASQTFASVALKAYKEYGNKAPIISIENPPYGTALSTGNELKNLIQKSREEFVNQAVKEGIGKSEAKEAAERLIGVTWDTSHISMMRKQGYDAKELIEESRKVAPFVKHVHLNDNFGHTHTDLPPGMGNVPIGKIMEEFGKKGFKGKKIVEGGNFFQHFQMGPHALALEAMGSPVYSMVAQPSWNQVAQSYGGYFAGYGRFLTDQHFNMYGSSWHTLPVELGGQAQGGQSRMTGTPTE